MWAGRRFLTSGWTELRHLAPGMNSLVMLGSLAAYLFSVFALTAPLLFPHSTANLYSNSLRLRRAPPSTRNTAD